MHVLPVGNQQQSFLEIQENQPKVEIIEIESLINERAFGFLEMFGILKVYNVNV